MGSPEAALRAMSGSHRTGLDRDDAAHGRHGDRDERLHALGDGQGPVVGHRSHRRDGVAHVAGVVGLGDLDHVDSGAVEHDGELTGLVGKKPALAARRSVGIDGDDGELVLDHQLGRGLLDGGDDLEGVAGAVLERAAVLVGAVVERGGAKRPDQAVAVDLDGVDAGLLGTGSGRGDGRLDVLELLDRGLGDEVLHVMVELCVGLLADLAGLGHLRREGRLVAGRLGLLRRLGGGHGAHDHAAHAGDVVLGMEELERELGAVLVHRVGKCLEGGDLGVGRELRRRARGHDGRDVADDDVRDAALGEALIEGEAARADGAVALLIAGGERREHDSVLELEGPDLDGLEKLRCGCSHCEVLSMWRGPEWPRALASSMPIGRDD